MGKFEVNHSQASMTPLRIVYVLTCPRYCRLSVMAYLSVQATRRLYPKAHVTLFCDCDTRHAMSQRFPLLLRSFNEVVDVPLSDPIPRMRALRLKTMMRSALSGDFVFLDIDTLPVRRFDDIVEGPWDLAAVQDRNHHCPMVPSYPHWRKADYDKLGWPYPLPKYFNTGVMFLRDNAATQRLAEEWQGHWRFFQHVCNDYDDQFPFNSALQNAPVKVREMDTSYNAMVPVHPIHARRAKIYHFFAGNQTTTTDTLFDYLIRHYETTGEIDWQAVDRCVAMDHPWMPPYWPGRLWQTGNRGLAVGLALTSLPRKAALALLHPITSLNTAARKHDSHT